jgi:tetratricopeptide (TPR) repeat protein
MEIHGEDHPDTTYTLYELGLLHQQAGNPKKAIDFFSKELNHCQNLYGPDHDETVSSRSNLVELMIETKSFALAAKELRHLSEHYKNLFANTPEEATCISISSLGKKFYECGLIEDAIEHLEISSFSLEKMVNDAQNINLYQYINVLEYLAFLFNKDGQRQKENDLKILIRFKKEEFQIA